MDFKNVQRRVYDALNVLSALCIIHKDRNRIHYKGILKHNGSGDQSVQNGSSFQRNENELKALAESQFRQSQIDKLKRLEEQLQ